MLGQARLSGFITNMKKLMYLLETSIIVEIIAAVLIFVIPLAILFIN